MTERIELEDDRPRVLRCCTCGRFVSRSTARISHETGDYGQIYSSEVACPRCP